MSARRLLAILLPSLLAASCATALPPSTPSGTVASAAGETEPPVTADLGEQRSAGGAVEIKASWVAVDPPVLKVTLDTHSVDLDRADLAALARVRLDGGEWVAPSAVDVPRGGHHREGSLRFAGLRAGALAAATVIELEIRDVAVPLRILRWERGG